MIKRFKILVLTDHVTHSKESSIYPLLCEMRKNKSCASIDVASRSVKENAPFFHEYNSTQLYVATVNKEYSFQEDNSFYSQDTQIKDIKNYDLIFLRIPQPIKVKFFKFLLKNFPENKIINKPSGIIKTGSKEYLMQFPQFCPEIKICHNKKDVLTFAKKFPIVLKPFRSYGGKGIFRIAENQAFDPKNREIPLDNFLEKLEKVEFLAMKYLKNVTQGDKRINVVNGKVVGATLRIPPKDSWICNVSSGGLAKKTKLTKEEKVMAKEISKILLAQGVVIFGFDTLVDDDGKRVLSEINTFSVGGFPQAERLSGEPVVRKTSDLLWTYIKKNIF